MTPKTRLALKELQQMDHEIVVVRSTIESFEPQLGEVDGPVVQLEREVTAFRKRLTEIRLEEDRLELSLDERRARTTKLEDKMNAVRNVREEAAVQAELEMVRRALESDEQEALSLLDQIRRLEERLEEQEGVYQEALAEVEPHRNELLQGCQEAEDRLAKLTAEREAFAHGIDPAERRVYESIMAGAHDIAVAELTQDGACGNCFSVVPLQVQNQIRHSDSMIRCEACGVILTPESAEGIARAEVEAKRIAEALKASEERRDAERAVLAAEMEAEAALEAEAEVKSEVEADAEPDGDTEVEADPEPEAEAEPEAEVKSEVEAEAEPDGDTEAEPEAEADAEPEAEPKSLADVEHEPEDEPKEGAAEA